MFLRKDSSYQVKETEMPHFQDEVKKSLDSNSYSHIEPQSNISSDIVSEQIKSSQNNLVNVVSEMDNKSPEIKTAPAESAEADNTKSNEKTVVWTFADEDLDFSDRSPVGISYFDDEAKVSGWSEAFVKIVNSMLEDYPSVIRGIAGYCFPDIGKVILSGNTGLDRLSKIYALNNGLYLETDCTPSQIIAIIRILMDKCNMDYDNIKLRYVIKNELSAQSFDSSVSTENGELDKVSSLHDDQRKGFENWLTKQDEILTFSAQLYISTVNMAGKYIIRLGISDTELYYIKDHIEVKQIIEKLFDRSEFKSLASGQQHRYRVALLEYVEYCKTLSHETPAVSQDNHDLNLEKKLIDFIAWARSQQIQDSEIKTHLLAMYDCSDFAKEHNYIQEDHIMFIDSIPDLEYLLECLQSDSSFKRFDAEYQNNLLPAINILIRYNNRNMGSEIPVATNTDCAVSHSQAAQQTAESSSEELDNSQTQVRYSDVLKEKFPEGFRPAKAIDQNRFRMYYSDMFGEELTIEDEKLVHILMQVGTLRDERIFVKDETEQNDLLEKINDTIMETFKIGASCIYLDCLFTKFQDQLAEMLHIYNVDSLESVLLSSKKRNYFKRYNYLCGYNKEPAPNNDVIEYMKNSHLPVTYSEIEKDLWYIPLDKIKHTLVTTPGIVNVASEEYLYAPNLPVSENELQQISELISHVLLQRTYISDVELIRLIEQHCPSVLMNTPDYPMWGLRNALAYLLRDKFSFRGAIISDKNEEISMAEVFSDFCRRSEHITVDELRNFASELNTIIYWDSVYGEMVRVNQNEFVRRDQIHFDIERIDSVLDSLIPSAYAPIKTINLFLHFPTIDVPWNSFVLESYVANYSKKFRLLHAGYTATDCCGAMVRQESGISDYRTLIVDVLSKNNTWKHKEDALQLLVDLGYQQRRSYSDIEKVMQEAEALMSAPKK